MTQLPLILKLTIYVNLHSDTWCYLISVLPISFLQVCCLCLSSSQSYLSAQRSCLSSYWPFSFLLHQSQQSIFTHHVQISHSRKHEPEGTCIIVISSSSHMQLRKAPLLLSVSNKSSSYVPPNPCSQGLSYIQLCSKHIWQMGNPKKKFFFKLKKNFYHSMLWLFCFVVSCLLHLICKLGIMGICV